MDPDYTPGSTAFSLKWSPWSFSGGLRIASLAVISKNHVGFRKIAIKVGWEPGQEPSIEVEDSDSAGICLFLSTDAFVEWEDMVRLPTHLQQEVLLSLPDIGPGRIKSGQRGDRNSVRGQTLSG
jgi:hypothetical protein